MPDNALPAPPIDVVDQVDEADQAAQVDLAALIPRQRVAEPEPEPEPPAAQQRAASPERLAFLWTLLGALAGSAVVAVGFLGLLTLLP